MKRLSTTPVAIAASLFLAMVTANQPAFAVQPWCGEQAFQGVGLPDQSPSGVMIQLVEVKRISPTDVRATWTLRNTTKTKQRLTKGGSGWSDGYHLAWDAELLDPAARVKYAVVKDKEGTPLAGKHPPAGPTSGIVLGAGRTMTTWATFSVPAEMQKVTVMLPGASTPFDDVAITAP